VIRCDSVTFEDTSREALFDKLLSFLKEIHPGKDVEVNYYFDMNSIPRWFHQYQNHYFNGKLYIKAK